MLTSVLIFSSPGFSHGGPLHQILLKDAPKALDALKQAGIPKNICGPDDLGYQKATNGCISLLDEHCTSLYSSENDGNLEVGVSPNDQSLRFGKNEFGLYHSYAVHAEAKLKFKNNLPKDFKTELDKSGYFEKLQAFLKTKTPDTRTFKSDAEEKTARAAYTKQSNTLSMIWNTAYEIILAARTKGSHDKFAEKRGSAKLDREINEAVWSNHPKWKQVENHASDVRDAMIETIKEMKLDPATEQNWIARMKALKIAIPGTTALTAASNPLCESTEINAHNYRDTNTIIVCGGIFTAEDPIATLTHEFSHSIDPGALATDAFETSPLAKNFIKLRDRTCHGDAPSCTEWKEIKQTIDAGLTPLAAFNPPPQKLNECLIADYEFKPMTQAKIESVAEFAGQVEIDSLINAGNNTFLKLAKSQNAYTEPDGTVRKEALNPCLVSGPEESFYSSTNALAETYFSNEYRCLTNADDAANMNEAIIKTREIATKLAKQELSWSNKYSDEEWSVLGGHSVNINERFSDIVGMKAYAKVLKKIDSQTSRRAQFLASNSHLCEEPGLIDSYSKHVFAEQNHSTEPHRRGIYRYHDLFNSEVRALLGCDQDFKHEVCEF